MPGVYHISYTLRSIRLRWRNCILIQRICDDHFEGFRKVLEMREKMRELPLPDADRHEAERNPGQGRQRPCFHLKETKLSVVENKPS